ncbi:hypothetical protein SFHH103_psfHH103d_250 (plasmid) [Sinorhizobium fredii HH103]|nr:hypothetical protein SFHH103_psfHH103d_250 [Sinorhizobium fredii HH103]
MAVGDADEEIGRLGSTPFILQIGPSYHCLDHGRHRERIAALGFLIGFFDEALHVAGSALADTNMRRRIDPGTEQ